MFNITFKPSNDIVLATVHYVRSFWAVYRRVTLGEESNSVARMRKTVFFFQQIQHKLGILTEHRSLK